MLHSVGRPRRSARTLGGEKFDRHCGPGTCCIARDLGDPNLWYTPTGYPDSLALCIVDSIYSTGAKYASVVNVVDRYKTDRDQAGGNANADGTEELLENIKAKGGADGWATAIGNRRPTSTSSGAPLKAQAIEAVATKLSDLRINSTIALRFAANDGRLEDAKRAWTSTPGQRSGITWQYALMLAGIPGVKADRMVVGYVQHVLQRKSGTVSPTEAADLVRRVAKDMEWDVIRTDHAIWRFESGRNMQRENNATESDRHDLS